MYFRKLSITSASLFTFLLITGSVLAQSPPPTSSSPTAGLTLIPPSFELTANVGGSLNNIVKLQNNLSTPVKIAVDRRNFTAIGEQGAVGLTEEETSFSLASWISVSPSEVTIAPGATQEFKFSVNVPLNAEPGGHFGSLVFRTIPTENLSGSGAALATELGSLILLRIAGSATEEAAIASFEPEKNFFEYGPVNLITRVKNQGNVHVTPTGTITITNMLGKKVAQFPLESRHVLPGAIRRLESTWDTNWGFGRYTATVVMVYGKDQIQRAAVTNFILLPYRVTAIVATILLIIAYLLFRSRRRLAAALKIIFTGKT